MSTAHGVIAQAADEAAIEAVAAIDRIATKARGEIQALQVQVQRNLDRIKRETATHGRIRENAA